MLGQNLRLVGLGILSKKVEKKSIAIYDYLLQLYTNIYKMGEESNYNNYVPEPVNNMPEGYYHIPLRMWFQNGIMPIPIFDYTRSPDLVEPVESSDHSDYYDSDYDEVDNEHDSFLEE